MNPLLHPHSTNAIQAIVENKPHAILLCGKNGIGLKTIARHIASQLDSAPLLLADEDGKPVSVQSIRTLYRKTSVKKNNTQTIIIDNADLLSPTAQNALLKLLEEPTEKTFFILVAHHSEHVLPTIQSRVWLVNISPVTKEQTMEMLSQYNISDSSTVQQYLYMSQGLPAEIHKLIHDKEYFELRASQIRTAREFLSHSKYEKMVTIYRLGSDRDQALQLIDDALHILYITVQNKPDTYLTRSLSTFIEIKEKLLQDGNVRIQLLRAVL